MIDLCRIGPPHEVAALLARARERFGDEVRVVEREEISGKAGTALVPWIRHPESLAPLESAFKLARRGRRVCWIDLDGSIGHCSMRFFARQSLRYLMFAGLDVLARVACTLVSLMPPARRSRRPADGPPVIVLPVLPDLSHTFVYREAARLLERDSEISLLVLERGLAPTPDHPEARALLARARFVQRTGIARTYLRLFAWLLRAPRRASRLLRAYRGQPGGWGGLLGKLPLREPRHPGNAFALATELDHVRLGPIHVYGSTYAANVAMGASMLTGRPYSITSYVDFDFDYDYRMLDEKLASSAFFRVCTAFCRTRIRELVPGADESRIPVILFGIDASDWRPRQGEPNGHLLFSACRLVPKKGLHDLPPALALLRDRGVEVEWRLAGDGDERAHLEQLIREHGLQDRVTLLGAVSSDVVRAELERATLAVLPCVVARDGERDGIPIFLTEAMARCVPVLSTRVSGIPEIVIDGESGFLTEPGDPQALADAIQAALADRARLAKIVRRGREIVCERLDIDLAADELLELVRASGR